MIELISRLRAALRRRVAERCGHPEDTFGPYQHKFGRWLDTGPEAREDDELAEVREAVARYLAVAAGEGRRWGTTLGVIVGGLGALVSFVTIRALS
ncbi:hypothetical protein [Actinoplanes regularis]|uniref:Uncharacterized protein n=1 Tax=Actinoplanes regularis TaxID=52697 RepID=A0A238ZVI3_9ACTN|nr:hypothetical protein [Actinoplanes regularis]GIE90224.1 hypothetical protein Are01nite_67040 [Actinoplanes regularis]SNR87355.1 hypothetical protein SAMN06264365_106345 [Actinoplanes regularis]